MLLAAFQFNAQITIVIDAPFPCFVLVTNLLAESAVLRKLADGSFRKVVEPVCETRAWCTILPPFALNGVPSKELANFVR